MYKKLVLEKLGQIVAPVSGACVVGIRVYWYRWILCFLVFDVGVGFL